MTSRHGKISLSIAVLAGLTLSAAPLSDAWAQSKKFAGTTITLGAPLNAPTRNLMKFLDRFKAETGITVNVQGMSNNDLDKKLTVESAAETGFFDLVRVSPHWISRLKEAGWIDPLDDRIKASNMDLDDFFESSLEVLGRIPGDKRIWALPLDANTGMLAYRTDLFNDPKEKAAFKKKYGYDLTPPKTTDQWLDTAEFFTRDTNGDGENDLFGLGVGQKSGGPSFIWTLGPFWSFGGEVMNEATKKITLNSPAAVAAMKWQAKMQKFQPKSSLSWGIYDNVGPMQAGRLAMSVQLFSFTADLLDPKKSKFFDRIAFTTLPVATNNTRGYTTGKYVFGGGGIVLHAHSKNKDAAWEFLSWMLSKERAPEYALAGTMVPRKSVMRNQKVLDANPAFKKTLPIFLTSLETVAKGRPKLPESGKLLRQLSTAWHDVALGKKTPEEALADAQKRMEKIMKTAGY